MEDSYSSVRPVAGRLFALDFRPARPLTMLGPMWSALCGAMASGALIFQNQWLLKLILVMLMSDALLGAWRALWLHADWRTALPRNLANERLWLISSSHVPSSLAERISRAITQRIRFVRTVIWPLIDSEIIGMLIAGIFALCIAILLGLVPMILTIIALALALIEGQLSPERGIELRVVYEVVLPWFIAQSAFGYFTWLSLVFVILFAIVYRSLLAMVLTRKSRWVIVANAAQWIVIGLLIAMNTPAGAGIVALGWLAQMLWQSRYQIDRDGRAYAQHVQSYLLVEMLVAGLALWL